MFITAQKVLVSLLLSLIFLISPATIFAQGYNATHPANLVTSNEIDLNNIPPTSPLYINIVVSNLLNSGICLMVGFSPVGIPCGINQTINQKTGMKETNLVYFDEKGGLIGSTTGFVVNLYQNKPLSTSEYLADVGNNLGIIPEAQAQVGGSGNAVLNPIIKLWQITRNVSYLLMTIIFVVIGVMIMLRSKINPQTVISVQAALPGLVIGLIMITFSYFFAALITDLAFVGTDLVGYYFALVDDPSLTNSSSLLSKTQDQNVLKMFGRLVGAFTFGDIRWGANEIMSNIQGLPEFIIRLAAALAAFQFGNAIGPFAGTTVGGAIGGTLGPIGSALGGVAGGALGGPIIGTLVGAYAFADPSTAVALAFFFAVMVMTLYTMFQLLLKLVNNYLTIVLLTITAPFHFMMASLPGRQSIASDWVKNMLCNVLAFPAVIAMFYFIAYLLGPTTGSVFEVGSRIDLAGGTTSLPLFGGINLGFMRILLAFGAMLALPAIPDVICKTIGKPSPVGQMLSQQISASQKGGEQQLNQFLGNFNKTADSYRRAADLWYGPRKDTNRGYGQTIEERLSKKGVYSVPKTGGGVSGWLGRRIFG